MALTAKPHRADARTQRPPFTAVVHSEWIKALSLPASVLALAGILAIGVGGSLFLGVTLESSGVPSVPSIERTLADVTVPTVVLGQIIAGIFGVMLIGAEYSSGAMQTTLTAVPHRMRVLAAKAVVAFTAVTVVALVTVFVSWAVTNPIYAGFGLDAPLTAPGVMLALVGSAVYLGLCAVFGLGVTTLVRSTTAGSIIVFAATLLLPVLSSLLPFGLLSRVLRLALLGNAGDAMGRVGIEGGPFIDLWSGHISVGAGWTIAAIWAAGALVIGAIALRTKDA
ncbi:ABC transporter permease subunit [Microbacterium thalli]|uniref:ABC transporter permease subunit n=1 Tax=Microbacterium thalli TaxID=3027921 RepID=A0ABT5SIP8_9MICO|nr:ABC transporter permease subunit [Microbacterium thalli]MDD7961937.1 ABC transporter permease subunit [Microbacterium thalli]MDN8549174.1 ABC transporter permease subunit [Microbacterium thalli]